jgi:hypothetical protein
MEIDTKFPEAYAPISQIIIATKVWTIKTKLYPPATHVAGGRKFHLVLC